MANATDYRIDDVENTQTQGDKSQETFEVDGKTLTREELMESYRKKRILETEMSNTRTELNQYKKAVQELSGNQTQTQQTSAQGVDPNLVNQLADVLAGPLGERLRKGGVMTQADLDERDAHKSAEAYATRMKSTYKSEDLHVNGDDLYAYMVDHNYKSASEAYDAMKARELSIHSDEVAKGFRKVEVSDVGSQGLSLNNEVSGVKKFEIKPQDLNKKNRRATITEVFTQALAANGIDNLDEYYREQGYGA